MLVGGPDQTLHLIGPAPEGDLSRARPRRSRSRCRPGSSSATSARERPSRSPSATPGRAVPELALIAFVAAFIGVGLVNVTFAFAVLGIPPILTNTYVGISQVDRNAVEAARGMGMSALQIILRVELPLAVPTIMAGVRTAAVNIIATVALASLAGVSTLGDYILGRNVYGDAGVVAGAILIALLTLTLELSLAGLQWLLTPRGLKLARAGAAA